MINFHYETVFNSIEGLGYDAWLQSVVESEKRVLGNLDYIFCDDAYLLKINQDYLDHDTFTDIITFDYTVGVVIGGDVFVSIERVKDNAATFKVDFEVELRRVLAHGVLHLCGYKDKTKEEASLMRSKEEEKIKMFHVEQ